MIGVILVLGVVVGIVVGSVWALQRKLIYFPDTGPLPPAAEAIDGARDVTLATADGLELTAWYVPQSGTDTGMAVLVAHGNGGSIADRAGLAAELADRGLAVLLLEYRGYGGNPGTPSEEGLALDAEAAVAVLEDLGHPPERTVYFGESLGTGVVARLATVHSPAGVVLRSPFTSLAEVGAHHYPWLPVRQILTDRFPVSEPLTSVTAPVVVIRGDRDSIVPTELSHRVATQAPTLVDEVVLPGDHNDAIMVGGQVADIVLDMAVGGRDPRT
ncbi:MAG: alpha/beta hydrolase [Actinomycetota bacterium]